MEKVKHNTQLNLKSIVDAFLLYTYKRVSDSRKRRYEVDTEAERIARTMRLEGDNVTTSDVKAFLSAKRT